MSGRMNGRHRLLNGTGIEAINGEVTTVRVTHHHPVDDLEPLPDPPRATRTHSAALKYLCGYDPRPLEEIASEVPCSKQRLSLLVCQIADRLGLGRRKRKTAPPEGETARVSTLTIMQEVNGEGAR